VTMLVIILFLACIPICRAITLSRRAGFRGFIGFTVFVLEAIVAREATVLAAGLREFDQGRVAARARLAEEVR
jgi:hypothetical protein